MDSTRPVIRSVLTNAPRVTFNDPVAWVGSTSGPPAPTPRTIASAPTSTTRTEARSRYGFFMVFGVMLHLRGIPATIPDQGSWPRRQALILDTGKNGMVGPGKPLVY